MASRTAPLIALLFICTLWIIQVAVTRYTEMGRASCCFTIARGIEWWPKTYWIERPTGWMLGGFRRCWQLSCWRPSTCCCDGEEDIVSDSVYRLIVIKGFLVKITLPQGCQVTLDISWSAPSHYLNQYWNIVNLTLRNKLQWNVNWNSYFFIQRNACENVVCKKAAILSWPQCVNYHCPKVAWHNVYFVQASMW